jgi:hypothetical protein
MDLLTALKILIRRWPVVLAGLVLTVVGVVQVGHIVQPSYEAKGTVLFLSPGAGNQYLEFPAGLEVTADALIVKLQSPAGGKRLEAAGATASYTLERTNGPIVEITANGRTDAEATKTVDLVVASMRSELESYQVAAPPNQQITLEALTEPTSKAKLGSRIRAQFAVGGIALAATVAAGLATDAIMRQMQEARLRREAEEEDDDDWGPPYQPGPAGRGYPPAEGMRPAHAPNGAHSGGPSVPVLSGGPNGRSSVYRPTPARTRADAPPDGPPAGERPVGGGRPGDRAPADRPAGDRPAGDVPTGDRPPLARRPTGPPPRPAGESRPAGGPPTADESRPAGGAPTAGDGRPSSDGRVTYSPRANLP